MASNPFRRGRGNRIPEDREEGDAPRVPTTNAFSSRRKKKVVTIQTPPQSPEDPPRRPSAGRISPPPPSRTPEDDAEESDSTATADSDLEQAIRNTRRNSGSLAPPGALGASTVSSVGAAPYNPFARTLATSEAAFGLQRDTAGQKDGGDGASSSNNGSGRPAMDVDQFKNILLNGGAVPTPSFSSTASRENAQAARFPDSSSNTDASSASHQSMFDSYLGPHSETPRTSFDVMESPSESSDGDDEESSGLMTSNERLDDFAPPAPPKHSHGRALAPKGPQTVSFADFDESIPEQLRLGDSPGAGLLGGKLRPPALKRSPSDLNKPLPPPPVSPKVVEPAQFDLTPPTPQDGPTAVTSTEENSETKKAPPPPPIARRGAQPSSGAARTRTPSDATQTSFHEEAPSTISKTEDSVAKAIAPPPPPPPSRKAKQPSQSDTPTPATSSPTLSPAASVAEPNATNPPPGPPPRRMASKAGNSINRASSSASRSSVQRKELNVTNSATPPPPAPPPRRGVGGSRQSMEIARTPSESDGWKRTDPASGETAAQSTGLGEHGKASEASADILADMTAFQREIDALRARAGRPG